MRSNCFVRSFDVIADHNDTKDFVVIAFSNLTKCTSCDCCIKSFEENLLPTFIAKILR